MVLEVCGLSVLLVAAMTGYTPKRSRSSWGVTVSIRVVGRVGGLIYLVHGQDVLCTRESAMRVAQQMARVSREILTCAHVALVLTAMFPQLSNQLVAQRGGGAGQLAGG